MKQKAIIIGAGIGGLATAALLGKMGYRVTVLEKNKNTGGRAMQFSARGYRFDMGPGMYFMPDVLERFFKLFRKKPTDFYKLKRLDPQYRIFFSSEDFVDIRSSIKENYRVFEQLEPGSAAGVREYLNRAREQYRTVMDDYVYKNYRGVTDLLNLAMVSGAAQRQLFETLDHTVSRYTTNKKLQKILLYYVMFFGGSAVSSPAFYSVLSHNDFHRGMYYPTGGMHKIVAALEALCGEYNVEIRTAYEAIRINIERHRAVSVETKNKKFPADLVVSNADYPFTEISLLESGYQSYPASYWRSKTIGPSAFVMHLGIKGKLKKLKHHNMVFNGEDMYYIGCPSKSDATAAPHGCETVSVHIPVASGVEDNELVRAKRTRKAFADLEALIQEPIRKRIVTQRIISVRDYQTLYNSYNGTAFGLAPTVFQAALFRPSNRSKKVRNLYYAGQYTVPGASIPMCLISSQLATERIRNEQ